MLVFTPLMLILNFLPIETEPWVWVKAAILGVGVLALIAWAIRFSLWQRDEYGGGRQKSQAPGELAIRTRPIKAGVTAAFLRNALFPTASATAVLSLQL